MTIFLRLLRLLRLVVVAAVVVAVAVVVAAVAAAAVPLELEVSVVDHLERQVVHGVRGDVALLLWARVGG